MVTAVPLRSFIWPARHHDLARLDAAQDRDLIAARGAQLDEALLHCQLRLALVVDAVFLHDDKPCRRRGCR